VTEGWTILVVVVADLVASAFDSGNQFWVAQSPFANQEEGGLGVMALQNVQDLRSESRMRAIIEREGDKGKVDSHTIDHVWSEPLEHTEGSQGLYPEHQKPNCNDESTYREKHLGFSCSINQFR
jgi:hypothetical protein